MIRVLCTLALLGVVSANKPDFKLAGMPDGHDPTQYAAFKATVGELAPGGLAYSLVKAIANLKHQIHAEQKSYSTSSNELNALLRADKDELELSEKRRDEAASKRDAMESEAAAQAQIADDLKGEQNALKGEIDSAAKKMGKTTAEFNRHSADLDEQDRQFSQCQTALANHGESFIQKGSDVPVSALQMAAAGSGVQAIIDMCKSGQRDTAATKRKAVMAQMQRKAAHDLMAVAHDEQYSGVAKKLASANRKNAEAAAAGADGAADFAEEAKSIAVLHHDIDLKTRESSNLDKRSKKTIDSLSSNLEGLVAAAKELPEFAEQQGAVDMIAPAFIQMPSNIQAFESMSRQALSSHSPTLSLVAANMAQAGSGGLDKVKKMLSNNVKEVEAAKAKAEAEHGACQRDLKAMQADSDNKSNGADAANGQHGTAEEKQSAVQDKINGLVQKNSDLTLAMADASKARSASETEHSEAVAQADDSMEKITKGWNGAKDNIASDDTRNQIQKVVDAMLKKLQDNKDGTQNAEKSESEAFEQFKSETEEGIKSANADLHAAKVKVISATANVKRTEIVAEEADKAAGEAAKILDDKKTMCTKKEPTRAEKVATMQQEIDGLENAQAILEGV